MSSSLPSISIVTPSYNQGDFLEKTIRSVLDQNYPNLQYAVVDGASTDQSPQIIEKYRDRLTWGVSEPDRGHADAINKGFAHTSGEIMAWLNSDDLYYPWTFQVVGEIFAQFPDIEWLTGIPSVVDAKDRTTQVHPQRTTLNRWDFLAGRYGWIQQESTFWRRSLWEKAGGAISSEKILMIDGELWTRFFDHAELWRVNTVIGSYRMHGINRAATERDRVDREMRGFCRDMLARAPTADRLVLAESYELRKNCRSSAAAHPCSKLPILFWDGGTDSWIKGIIWEAQDWPEPLPSPPLEELPPTTTTPPPALPDGSAWPRITIVTPSYQQAAYLEETIRSIHEQQYPNLEHIIIDGGSTDGSVEIIRKWESHLAHWTSERDRGQSDALNKGFARATGDILTWLNSDDQLAPGALHAVALAFHQNPDADILAGIVDVRRDGTTHHRHLTSCPDGPLPLHQLLDIDHHWLNGTFFYQPEVFFRKSLWQRAGANVRTDLNFAMDYELWVRFAKADARLKVIGRTLAIFREHDQQKTDFSNLNFLDELRAVAGQNADGNAPTGASAPPPAGKTTPALRIAMLNDIGYCFGAGIAHARVAQSIALAGHTVRSFAVTPDTPDNPGLVPPAIPRLIHDTITWQPDVIIIGSMHNAGITPAHLELIPKSIPVILFLHDLWWLTGRCPYHGTCDRLFNESCDHSCPTADQYPAMDPDKIHHALDAKRHFLNDTSRPILIAANSQWTLDTAKQILPRFSVDPSRSAIVHFAPDPSTFIPRDQTSCRELLDLPKEPFIVLFSASSITDRRKGLHLLSEALVELNDPSILPVCIGHTDADTTARFPNLRSFGYVDSPALQARLLSAADVFVGPSTEEAFGQVFVEAAACGTPSIAFNLGGIPDAIHHNTTGILIDQPSHTALAETIQSIKSDPALLGSLKKSCLIHTNSEHTHEANYRRIHPLLTTAASLAGIRLTPKIHFESVIPPVPPASYAIGGDRNARHEIISGLLKPWRKEDFMRLAFFHYRHAWKTSTPLQKLNPLTLLTFIAYKSIRKETRKLGIPMSGEPIFRSRPPSEVAADLVDHFRYAPTLNFRKRKAKGWKRRKNKLFASAAKHAAQIRAAAPKTQP